MTAVYYLVHAVTRERVRYYKTLAGARIAQRSRNAHLGFTERIQRRETEENWEVELCVNSQGEICAATWVIVEDVVEIAMVDSD